MSLLTEEALFFAKANLEAYTERQKKLVLCAWTQIVFPIYFPAAQTPLVVVIDEDCLHWERFTNCLATGINVDIVNAYAKKWISKSSPLSFPSKASSFPLKAAISISRLGSSSAPDGQPMTSTYRLPIEPMIFSREREEALAFLFFPRIESAHDKQEY